MKKFLLAAFLTFASPAFADNFVFSDAAGNFVVFPCTTANGVCTPVFTNGSPTVDQEVDLVEVGGVAISLGQKAMAASLPVVLPSDQAAIPVTQSGTWTVQPGNTPNTSAWLMTDTPSSASGAAIAAVVSTAVETGHVVKNSAGNLYSVSVTTGASAGRVLVHNTTAVPAAGAVTPVDCAIVAANSTVMLSYDPPLRLGTGISVSFSTASTCFTQTDSATAFISGKAS